MTTFTHDYWERAAASDPFGRVRTGWQARDFDLRTDDSVCHAIAFKPDDVVLDYGCGPGYTCRLVAPQVARYVGMDYSGRMLDIARIRCAGFPNAAFVQNDGASIPADSATFDCVYCELVFQHLPRWDTLKILGEMKRVLKPGGRVALQFPTPFYGAHIGFTVNELAMACPGWRVVPDENYPDNYIMVTR